MLFCCVTHPYLQVELVKVSYCVINKKNKNNKNRKYIFIPREKNKFHLTFINMFEIIGMYKCGFFFSLA